MLKHLELSARGHLQYLFIYLISDTKVMAYIEIKFIELPTPLHILNTDSNPSLNFNFESGIQIGIDSRCYGALCSIIEYFIGSYL